ncbi:MAG: hypothetical protein CMK89_10650 [Pseudomonadales bacterium]|nr:hypothetical protein [Pseudomonadales bacterium]
MAAAPGKRSKPPSNQRRIPQQKRAQEKYNAVLDACTQVLGQQDYGKITMLELSLESGVAVPTIYQYFDNKEAILLAWMDRMIDQVLATVSRLKSHMENDITLNDLVRGLLQGALSAFQTVQRAIANLLQQLPQTLSQQLLCSVEEKTLQMIKRLLPEFLPRLGDEEAADIQLRVLIKMIGGFLLFSVIKGEENNRLQAQGEALEHIVMPYLLQLGHS